jgi:hypothetical protein
VTGRLQQFECAITEVDAGSVWVEMADLTDKTRPMEFASFSATQFDEKDRQYLKPGVVFLWTLTDGLFSSSGVSKFHFSGERWTREALERVKTRAAEICKHLEIA